MRDRSPNQTRSADATSLGCVGEQITAVEARVQTTDLHQPWLDCFGGSVDRDRPTLGSRHRVRRIMQDVEN